MLKPIELHPQGIRQVREVPELTRTCEACGKQDLSPNMINVMMVVGSPGHPTIAPFQCPQEEHWACSPECWSKVAHACIDEHMVTLLNYHRGKVGL